MIEFVLFTIGALYLLKGVLIVVSVLIASLYRKKEIKGHWALVTAGTDGLGLGFCEELARKGINLVIVGRNLVKIKSVAQMIKEKFNVQVNWVVKDFEKSSDDPIRFFGDIFQQIEDIPVDILVNNVGGSHVKSFIESTKIHSIINLNIFPATFMTKFFLDKVRKSQKEFSIITISSVAHLFPGSKLVTYRASKSFNFVLSDILSSELPYYTHHYKSSGEILCLTPSLIETPATSYLKSRPLIITKNECAKHTIESLGCCRSTSGHFKHQIMYLMNLLASVVEPWIGHLLIAKFEDV